MKAIKIEEVRDAFANVNRRTFKDVRNGRLYRIDSIKLVESMNGYIKEKSKATLRACYTDIEERTGCEARRIQNLITFCRTGVFPGESEDRPYKDGTILSYMRSIGLFFGDEGMFLKPVDLFDEEWQKKEKKKEKIREIVAMIDDILRQIDKSSQYSYLPDGSQRDGWQYYDERLEQMEHRVVALFLGEKEVEERLKNLIEETRIFVRSFSRPGVVPRWCEISQEIMYFDCVYDVLELDWSTYENAKELFAFQPTEEQIKKRQEYFEILYRKNYANNTKYSEERLFQEEVLRTFGQVVRHDFPELLS